MRVISGKYKGKQLIGFNINGTRPTMDRVKESLFAMIQDKIKGSICLDLFAGSASLGIEALSNGALEVYFVDNNFQAINTIKKNTIGMPNVNIINSDYKDALKKINNIKFDIIFLDPPYDLLLINNSLKLIKKYELLNKNGLIICEYTKEKIDNIYPIYKEKKYKEKSIKIFKAN